MMFDLGFLSLHVAAAEQHTWSLMASAGKYNKKNTHDRLYSLFFLTFAEKT